MALLDSGIPVEINAFEHSRTAIAYNDEHILFADNWHPTAGLKSVQKCDPKGKFVGGGGGAGKRIELFAASFSRVNKWHVYSMMRDIVYFEPPAGTPIANKKERKDYSQWSRSELRAAARGGQLKQYGANGNSSPDAIRRALRKKNRKNNKTDFDYKNERRTLTNAIRL